MAKVPTVRPLFLFLFLLAVAPAFAQQQEKRLEERLLGKPDQKKVFDLRQSAFSGTNFQAGTARSKDFYFSQKFSPKQFYVGEFSTKKSWFGGLKFWGSRNANTKGKYEIPNGTKQADVKTVPVKAAYDADKKLAVRELPGANRPYLGPEAERVHKPIDPNNPPVGWSGDLKEMTIDDIRELLNKNK